MMAFATEAFALVPIAAVELPPPNVTPVQVVELQAIAAIELPAPNVIPVAAIELTSFMEADAGEPRTVIPVFSQSQQPRQEKQTIAENNEPEALAVPVVHKPKESPEDLPADYNPAYY